VLQLYLHLLTPPSGHCDNQAQAKTAGSGADDRDMQMHGSSARSFVEFRALAKSLRPLVADVERRTELMKPYGP